MRTWTEKERKKSVGTFDRNVVSLRLEKANRRASRKKILRDGRAVFRLPPLVHSILRFIPFPRLTLLPLSSHAKSPRGK